MIGETLEQAQYAASLVSAECTAETAVVDFEKALDSAKSARVLRSPIRKPAIWLVGLPTLRSPSITPI